METKTTDKKVEDFFEALDLMFYTNRHASIVKDFLEGDRKDLQAMLTKLGAWDDEDLEKAEKWLEENMK
jgi:hypothetical protein